MLRPISDRLRFRRDGPGDGPEYRDRSSSFPDLCSILDPSSHQYQREETLAERPRRSSRAFFRSVNPPICGNGEGSASQRSQEESVEHLVSSSGDPSLRKVSTSGLGFVILSYGLGWRCRPWHANRNSRREQLKSMGQLNPHRWQLLKKPFAKFWRTPAPKTTEILAVSTSE
ncbi:hypothetical protein ZIOFF_054925 [Zingiber officinale]|uniref:Uncharacterized protein n=1 Tax=Zingiber officinale TaxID=94328 RepID=A0A8J5FGP0_ZINOF|nr:hypothetical protein ZIOFF_054925 [Zingiber officinale]